jgi:hypothetical protein
LLPWLFRLLSCKSGIFHSQAQMFRKAPPHDHHWSFPNRESLGHPPQRHPHPLSRLALFHDFPAGCPILGERLTAQVKKVNGTGNEQTSDSLVIRKRMTRQTTARIRMNFPVSFKNQKANMGRPRRVIADWPLRQSPFSQSRRLHGFFTVFLSKI